MAEESSDQRFGSGESESKAKVNSEKNVLESRTFKDGAIYLFIREDYKKKTWMCRIKVPNRKGYVYRSTRTTDEHEAYKFADDLYHDELVKSLSGPKQQGERIGKAIDEYVQRFESKRSMLSIHYKLLLIERCRSFLEKKTFDQLDTRLISQLYEELSKNSTKGSLSENSIRRIQSDLRHFLNWCVEAGFLDELPKLPKIKTQPSRRPHFDSNTWRRLVRHFREFVKVTNRKTLRDRSMLRDYVLILGNTGIRVGEAHGLKWRDVREELGDEQGKSIIVLTVRGKTGIREVVARNTDVKKYLKRIFDLRVAELSNLKGENTEPALDNYIFCHPDGSPIKSFKKSFNSLIKSAGVERDTFGDKRTVYSLRHTYATFRLQEGTNHYALAQNMGTSVSMLEKHYGHTTNVSAASELTKSRERTHSGKQSPKNAKRSEFGWLSD
ncbi:tyrosine-type recombinase/integrase [Qipengyuania sp. DGS5-3]|uniref:tyrosine-type recombinase/integrase n=1 Tax=Qipengyuania sp. DGS5-3 TaxID=3349632 RepID=UPI0036D3D2DF